MEERFERKLAAVVAADIVGFSRLMAADEDGTLARVNHLRNELFDPTIAEHGGQIVKRTGDGSLVEFDSIVDAVRASIEIQENLVSHEAAVDEDQRIVLRIGVNLGDIIFDDGDIYGDGVNVAARLEQLCFPGEVLISGTAFDHLGSRVEFNTRYLGEQQLKNIPGPVRVYRISIGTRDNAATEMASVADAPMLQELPDKPSVVVLPFTNMSGNPDQHLCDGLTEDITTALSRFEGLFVIARNTAFTFKGQNVSVRDVSRELGVQYVLEGSMRIAGGRIRANPQLIDAVNDRHVWADKIDADLNDIFEVQDAIVRQIVGEVAPEIEADTVSKVLQKPLFSLKDQELIYRAAWHQSQYTPENNLEAEEICLQLLSRNPLLAEGHARLSWGYLFDAVYSWNRPPAESLQLAHAASKEAIALDSRSAMAQTAFGMTSFMIRKHEAAMAALQTAIDINPNYSSAIGFLGLVQCYTHDFGESAKNVELAVRLSPKDPMRAMFIAHRGQLKFNQGKYQESIKGYQQAIRENPRLPSPLRGLAAAYGMLGDLGSANETLLELNKLLPGISLSATRGVIGFAYADDEERFLEGLRRAGMPE